MEAPIQITVRGLLSGHRHPASRKSTGNKTENNNKKTLLSFEFYYPLDTVKEIEAHRSGAQTRVHI